MGNDCDPRQVIKDNEGGYRQYLYPDSVQKLTIGYGRNVQDIGISEDEAQLLQANQPEAHPTPLHKKLQGDSTIGYGRNLRTKGISQGEADYFFENDFARAQQTCQQLFGSAFTNATQGRKTALLDMAFNLGPKKLAGFQEMGKAILAGDWDRAASEAEKSLWYTQVKNRAVEDVRRLRTGGDCGGASDLVAENSSDVLFVSDSGDGVLVGDVSSSGDITGAGSDSSGSDSSSAAGSSGGDMAGTTAGSNTSGASIISNFGAGLSNWIKQGTFSLSSLKSLGDQVLDSLKQKALDTGASILENTFGKDGISGMLSEFLKQGDFSLTALKKLGNDAFSYLKTKGLESLSGIVENIFGKDGIGKILGDFVKQGEFSLNSLKDLALKIFSNLVDSIFSGKGGAAGGILDNIFSGIGNFFSGIFGSLFGGGGGDSTPIPGVSPAMLKSFGGRLTGGGGGGILGGIFDFITSLFGTGGIMTGSGPLALARYAGGGVASMPQLALFGEDSNPEAFVPLPDGRSIPVTLRGNNGRDVALHAPINVNVNATGPLDKNSGKQIGADVARAIHREVSAAFADMLRQQTRLGGILNPI